MSETLPAAALGSVSKFLPQFDGHLDQILGASTTQEAEEARSDAERARTEAADRLTRLRNSVVSRWRHSLQLSELEQAERWLADRKADLDAAMRQIESSSSALPADARKQCRTDRRPLLAEFTERWAGLVPVLETGAVLAARHIANVEQGVLVDVGLVAFIPESQLLEKDRLPRRGETIQVRITKMRAANDTRPPRIRASARAAAKARALSGLQTGQIHKGPIVAIKPFGAFVRLHPALDGLVPTSEISWSSSDTPERQLQRGQEVLVEVTSVDPDAERVSLSIRRTQPDPLLKLFRDEGIGGVVRAKILDRRGDHYRAVLDDGIRAVLPATGVHGINPGLRIFAAIEDVDLEKRLVRLSVADLRTPERLAKIVELRRQSDTLIRQLKSDKSPRSMSKFSEWAAQAQRTIEQLRQYPELFESADTLSHLLDQRGQERRAAQLARRVKALIKSIDVDPVEVWDQADWYRQRADLRAKATTLIEELGDYESLRPLLRSLEAALRRHERRREDYLKQEYCSEEQRQEEALAKVKARLRSLQEECRPGYASPLADLLGELEAISAQASTPEVKTRSTDLAWTIVWTASRFSLTTAVQAADAIGASKAFDRARTPDHLRTRLALRRQKDRRELPRRVRGLTLHSHSQALVEAERVRQAWMVATDGAVASLEPELSDLVKRSQAEDPIDGVRKLATRTTNPGIPAVGHHGLERIELGVLGRVMPLRNGRGGEGRVATLDRHPGVALKRYFRAVEPHRWSSVDSIAESINGQDRMLIHLVDSATTRPQLVVQDQGQDVGILMRRLHPSFHFRQPSDREALGLLTFGHLMVDEDRKPLLKRSITFPSGEERVLLLARVLEVIKVLHSIGVALGDISHSNFVWSLDPIPSAQIIDCDSWHPIDQVPRDPIETPDWRVPWRHKDASPLVSDSYKAGLLVLRTLTGNHRATPGGPIAAARRDLPRSVSAEVVALFGRTLARPAQAPTIDQLIDLLGSHDPLVLSRANALEDSPFRSAQAQSPASEPEAARRAGRGPTEGSQRTPAE